MIGTQLKELRTKKGWTQVQLAEASGVRQGELTYYEKNLRTPTAPKLAALARALRVPMEALISGEDIPQEITTAAEPKVHGNSTAAQVHRILSQLDQEHQRSLLHHARLLLTTQEIEQATTPKNDNKRPRKAA